MKRTRELAQDIALSLDRARVYRGLAQVFRRPDAESVQEACERNLPELCQALERLTQDASAAESSDLIGEARTLCDHFEDTDVEQLRRGHHSAFDESSGTRCAPTEMDQLGGVQRNTLRADRDGSAGWRASAGSHANLRDGRCCGLLQGLRRGSRRWQ